MLATVSGEKSSDNLDIFDKNKIENQRVLEGREREVSLGENEQR